MMNPRPDRRANQAEALGALFLAGDVGDVGGRRRDRGAGDARDGVADEQQHQRVGKAHDGVVDGQAGERNQDDRAAPEAVREVAERRGRT